MAAEQNQVASFMTEQFGSIGSMAAQYWWVPVVLIIAVIFWIFMHFRKKYPLNAVVWERRGDDIVTNLKEKLGRVNEDGIWKWKFRKGDTLPPANYEFVAKIVGGNGCVHFLKYGPGQYKVIDIRELFKSGSFRLIDQDDWNFKVLEFRATTDRRKALKDFMEKYGAIISIGVMCMTLIVIAYMSFQHLQSLPACANPSVTTTANAPAQVPNVPIITDVLKTD